MNFHATRARDRAECAESARTEREFIADIHEAVAAVRDSLEANEASRDQQLACTAILAACRHQMTGRLRVVAESKDEGWALRDIDNAAAHDPRYWRDRNPQILQKQHDVFARISSGRGGWTGDMLDAHAVHDFNDES